MTALLVYFGGLSVTQGIVTAGAWYLFIVSMDRFMYPIMNLSSFWTQVQTGLAAAERVFALMDASHAVVQNQNIAPPAIQGAIRFQDIDFHYKENEPTGIK
jgi:ATP-binding cassette subfamily B protein